MMRDSTRDQMRGPTSGRTLILATTLTLGFAAVEPAAGWWSGSLALLSDAGHIVTDAAALLIAAIAGFAVILFAPSVRILARRLE